VLLSPLVIYVETLFFLSFFFSLGLFKCPEYFSLFLRISPGQAVSHILVKVVSGT
jgi:hypothetical protein